MPSQEHHMSMVVSQMMKGPHPGRIKANKRLISAFTRRHEDKIRWVLEQLPQHKRVSAAVPAVVAKALIVYGFEKTLRFCKALTDLQFSGVNDPAHLLWMYLLRSKDQETRTIYQKTVCAVRAYMDGKVIPRLSPLKQDLFTWDEDFSLPDDLIARNNEAEARILAQRAAEARAGVPHSAAQKS